MDAEKIKKKLNGSILKGTKVRIETARPKKELVLHDGEPAKPKKEKEMKGSNKRKRGQETIPAVEIGDRSVKRGWTTPTAAISKKNKGKDKDGKKSVVKSKYTTGPECLFKTVLPPNVAANVEKREGKPEKKKRKADKDTVVHEFSKTTKYATFLRGPAGAKKTKGSAEFVEGKGWVDEDGNVVEGVSRKDRKRKAPLEPPAKAVEKVEPDDSTSEDESSDPSSSSEEEEDTSTAGIEPPLPTAIPLKEDSPTSSSGSSSEEESESEASSSSQDESDAESSGEEEETPKKIILPPISTSRPQSSSGPSSGLSITIPDFGITSTTTTGEVHPLEALYKRPRPNSLGSIPKPTASSFSFFGADGDDLDEEEAQDQVPLTPFTQKDFEYRGIRSAAPTPDTAHANKRFVWPVDNDEDEEDEEASSPTRKESPAKTAEPKMGEAESDFQKWFYENRGETNRAWKKRRKIVAKEKRQRENRKRNDRAF